MAPLSWHCKGKLLFFFSFCYFSFSIKPGEAIPIPGWLIFFYFSAELFFGYDDVQVNCCFCFVFSLRLWNSSTSLSGGAQKVSQKLSGFSGTFDIVSDYFRNIITIQFRSTSLLCAISFSVLHSSQDCSLQRKQISLFLLAWKFLLESGPFFL